MADLKLLLKPYTKHKAALFLVLVTLIAGGVRVAYFQNTRIEQQVLGDAGQYVIYGYNLSVHGTFSKEIGTLVPRPDSYRSPGFPLLIALGMKLFGFEIGYYNFIMILHLLLGTLLAPLTYCLCREILGPYLSFFCALLVAIDPHLVAINGTLLSETSFAFFHLSGLLLFVTALRKNSFPAFLLSGFLFGYSYLVNQVILYVPLILAVVLFAGKWTSFREGKENSLLKGTAGFLIVFLVFPLGWGLRNQISLGQNVPRSKERIINNLVIGSHPDFFMNWKANPTGPEYVAVQKEIRDAEGTYSGFASGFIPRFFENPLKYLTWYSIRKPPLLYSWDIQYGKGDVFVYPVDSSAYKSVQSLAFTRIFMRKTHGLMMLLFLGGVASTFMSAVRGRIGCFTPEALITYTMIYITIVYMILQSEPRFSIPFRSEFYILALLFGHKLYLRASKIPSLIWRKTRAGLPNP